MGFDGSPRGLIGNPVPPHSPSAGQAGAAPATVDGKQAPPVTGQPGRRSTHLSREPGDLPQTAPREGESNPIGRGVPMPERIALPGRPSLCILCPPTLHESVRCQPTTDPSSTRRALRGRCPVCAHTPCITTITAWPVSGPGPPRHRSRPAAQIPRQHLPQVLTTQPWS